MDGWIPRWRRGARKGGAAPAQRLVEPRHVECERGAGIRAAVIGVGAIARQHLLCLGDMDGVEVVAVCDRSRPVAEAAAERYRVPAHYGDHRELLERANPDVVHVTTPMSAHRVVAADALAAGAHVIVEKPITAAYDETRELLSEAERRGRVLIENYNYVFNAEVQEVLRLVATGALGDVTHVEVDLALDILSPGSPFTEPGHPTASMPGGAIADFLPHLASLAYFLAGPHRAVSTSWSRQSSAPLEADELRALVAADGATVAISFSARSQPDAFRMRVHGTRMRAAVNLFEPRLAIERRRDLPGPLLHLLNGLGEARSARRAALGGLWRKLSGGPGAYEGLWSLLHRTYAAIESGSAPPVSLEQVDRVNRLVADLTRDEYRM
jgi:predicted dehydrogenase